MFCVLVHPFGKKIIFLSSWQSAGSDSSEDSEQNEATNDRCWNTKIDVGSQITFQLVSETQLSIIQILGSADVTEGYNYHHFLFHIKKRKSIFQ